MMTTHAMAGPIADRKPQEKGDLSQLGRNRTNGQPGVDDETKQMLVGMQAQIRELVGAQATLLSELEKANKSLQALRDSMLRSDRQGRGSGK